MSTSADDAETHPGQDLSVSQLLYAAQKELQDTGSVGWVTTTLNEAEMDGLERDALEVLRLVKSENTFALINKLPAEVFTQIPDYWQDNAKDPNLITLTHVCRGWRDVLTSYASLWTRLDFANVDKTRVYLERSNPLPLNIRLEQSLGTSHWEEALPLVVPHTSRLKTLSISGNTTQVLAIQGKYFHRAAPLLEQLVINLLGNQSTALNEEFLNGNFSSLRNLSLIGVVPPSIRSKMPNLTILILHRASNEAFPVTRLLTLLEAAPGLRYVHLHDSIPSSSDAPADRLVPLPHLKKLSIGGQPAHSILLDHLSVPVGATVKLEFPCSGKESPLNSYLPKSSINLHNLRQISAVNLCFGTERRFLRLRGPSGGLWVLGNWTCDDGRTSAGTNKFLWSLRKFDLSGSRWLTTRWCNSGAAPGVPIVDWDVYQTLRSMESLHTLTLIQSINHPFILSLNPAKNPSNIVLCPNLKEIAFYVESPDQLCIDELLEMAEERAFRGAKLSVVTISMGELAPPKDVSQLRKHVSRLKCGFNDAPPEWDKIPGQIV